MVFRSAMNCPLLQRSPWYCTLFLTAFLSGASSWRQRVERSERNGEVKGEFSWLKSVKSDFFEAIKLWEQKDQLLRKSSRIKLLKMVLESKEINKQLVIVQCQSLIGACFFFEIRLRLNFAENSIFNICVFVETHLVWNELIQIMFLCTLGASKL